jgi:hypothetical protein
MYGSRQPDLLLFEKRSVGKPWPCSYRQANNQMENRIGSYAASRPNPDTRVPGTSAIVPVPALLDMLPDKLPSVARPAAMTGESCIYAALLESAPIALDSKLCCTVGQGEHEADYFLLEHIRSGHYNGRCPLLSACEDAPVELAPIRTELPFDNIRCLTSASLDEPLRSPRHIRLIALQPRSSLEIRAVDGSTSGHLMCEVYQTSLDEISTKGQPLFMAVSYVCGDQKLLRCVRCGTELVGLPQNAYYALLHLRFDDRPRLIWIDHLCIKQTDDQEKSHQVRLLHKIYSQAHVVSWLGTGCGIDLQCVSFYIPLLAHFWITSLRGEPKRRWRETSAMSVVGLERYLVAQATLPRPRFSADTLVSIFNTGYFERVWTIQEIILGKTNTCQIGDAVFSLAVLTAAAAMLDSSAYHPAPILEFESTRPDCEKLENVLYHYLHPALHKHWTLNTYTIGMRDPNVVMSSMERHCMDQRDHIYGLTSLFEAPDEYDVDYTLSLGEVLADFTVHCMLNGLGIDALNSRWPDTASLKFLGLEVSDLPSWSPNWTDSEFDLYLQFTHEQSRECDWRASGALELVHSRPSKLALTLRGLAVAKTTLCSDYALRQAPTFCTDSHRLIWLEQGESLCTFFESLGIQTNHNTIDLILRVFDRILIPKAVNIGCYHYAKDDTVPRPSVVHERDEAENSSAHGFSHEMHSLFKQIDTNDHVRDLLAPAYLSKVDPKLYRAAGFEVDARIPLGDFALIEETVRRQIRRWSGDTRLFAMDNGMIGNGYDRVEEGDLVCLIYGSNVPQILRESDDQGHYILVGACNVDGLMFGEGLEMGLEAQDFILV